MTLPSQASTSAAINPTARNKRVIGEVGLGLVLEDRFESPTPPEYRHDAGLFAVSQSTSFAAKGL